MDQLSLPDMPAPERRILAPRGWAAGLARRDVQAAVDAAGWKGIVLPYTKMSDYYGFPVISWSVGVRERFRFGPGPVLVRPTLVLWERWPLGVSSLPPPSPIDIVGWVSVSTWRPAMRVTCALAAKGSMMILAPKRPSMLHLCAADYAGIHVVQVSAGGDCEVLVSGRIGPVETARRTTNIRYWEECLFAHALASWREDGVIPPGLLPAQTKSETFRTDSSTSECPVMVQGTEISR